MPLPTAAELTDPNVTEAQFKNGLADLLNSILSKQEINSNALFKPVALTSTSDLNDYVTTGLYYLTYSEHASTSRNFPAAASGVLRVQNRGANLVHQEYITTGNIFVRALGATEWTAWTKFATEKTLQDSNNALAQSLQDASDALTQNLQSYADTSVQTAINTVSFEINDIKNEISELSIHTDVTADNFDFAITDSNGNVVQGIKKSGAFYAQQIETDNINLSNDSIESYLSNKYAFAITDESGNTAFAVTNDGEVIFDGGVVEEASINIKHKKTDWIHGHTYGQSLSRGSGSYPVVSTSQPFNNLTFASGVLPRLSDDHDYTNTKPLVEQRWSSSSAEGESPTSGMLNKITELALADGNSLVMFGASSGQGGTRLENLSKGTTRYNEQLEMYQAAYNLAQSLGLSYSVGVIGFVQGESNYNADTSRNAYKSMMVKLKRDFDADICVITKQDFVPVMVTYQTASHFVASPRRDHTNIALAQWDAHRENKDIVMACSMYAIEYLTDNLHLTADSSLQLGKYLGKAAYKTMRYANGLSDMPFSPLEPIQAIWQGMVIDITFNVPTGNLTLDTTLVSQTHNYGFDIWIGDAVQANAISSVNIVDKNRVRIVLNNVYENAVLSYARGRPTDPVASGSINGPRGNLRDQAGDTDNYLDSKGVTRYMHNWCVIFQFSQNTGFN